MKKDRNLRIDARDEGDRLFDDSSISHAGHPEAVILMGGVATGKTTLRLRDYSHGYVLIDAAEIFHHLSQGDATLDFPDAFLNQLESVGTQIARRAVSEGRSIVTEIIGADEVPTLELISALKSCGYSVKVVSVTCDLEESIRRNEGRGDSISAYYAEPFQRRWIIDSCNFVSSKSVSEALNPRP
jgi:hypothetical protein